VLALRLAQHRNQIGVVELISVAIATVV